MTRALSAIFAAAVILFAASSLHRAGAEDVAPQQVTFQACVDCPVMRVNVPGAYVPPQE